jgi:hypothetical protein
MARTQFQFSLLPPKSGAVVELETERDNSVAYGALLIFVSVLIYFLLTLVQAYVVAPRLAENESALATIQSQKSTFQSVQTLNGELFIKTKTLKPVLEKQVDSTEIFRVTTAITAANPNLVVTSYNRETSGEFVFQIAAASFNEVGELLEIAKGIEGVSSASIKGSTKIQRIV